MDGEVVPEDEELLTIGRFARLSGLSAHTLRHYDDVGLLAPAVVDVPIADYFGGELSPAPAVIVDGTGRVAFGFSGGLVLAEADSAADAPSTRASSR